KGARGAPDLVRHPVVAEDRDSGAPQVADRLLHVLQLSLALRQPEHDLLVESHGDVLQRHQAQAGILGASAEQQQVAELPPPPSLLLLGTGRGTPTAPRPASAACSAGSRRSRTA